MDTRGVSQHVAVDAVGLAVGVGQAARAAVGVSLDIVGARRATPSAVVSVAVLIVAGKSCKHRLCRS